MTPLRVLIGCEASGVVRRAFEARGHDVYSCDLRPADDGSPRHIQGDVLAVIRAGHPCGLPWQLGIFHPPCTYLCNSSVWAFTSTRESHAGALYGDDRVRAMGTAVAFFLALREAPLAMIAIENPTMHGRAHRLIGRATQAIQPYEFGDDASKRTCLWLKNLPRLVPTRYVSPRLVGTQRRWSNQTDSGQNRESPSPDRMARRSQTYAGIAQAMADQWSNPFELQLSAYLPLQEAHH